MDDDAARERKLTRTVRRDAIDPDTGQALRLEWEEPLKRRPPKTGKSAEPFGLMFPEGARRLATLRLGAEENWVLWYLIGIMAFEDSFKINVSQMGRDLGIRQPNASRALASLRRRGLVIDMPNRRILLDPNIVWRGSLLSRMEMLARLTPAPKPRPEGTP